MFSNEIIFVVEEIAPTVAKDIIEDFFIHFDKKKSKSKSSAKSSYLLSGMYAIQIFRPQSFTTYYFIEGRSPSRHNLRFLIYEMFPKDFR